MKKADALRVLHALGPEVRERFGVRTLALFGSVARDQATADSDVDVLVAFDRPPDFDLFMDLRFFLEDRLGARVDLVTTSALRPPLRDAVEEDRIDVA